MVAIPDPPILGYSFTALVTANPNALLPGNFLDQEYNRVFNCLDDIIAALHVSLNADGTLNGSSVNAIVQALVGAAVIAASPYPAGTASFLTQLNAAAAVLPTVRPAPGGGVWKNGDFICVE